jgi:hypothetical protein
MRQKARASWTNLDKFTTLRNKGWIFPEKVRYTLCLFNIAMENGPFIDALPLKNGGSFHGYVK